MEKFFWVIMPIAVIVVVWYDTKKRKKNNTLKKNSSSSAKPKQPKQYSFWDALGDVLEDDKYVTRARRKRQEEKKKQQERARRKWYDDYDTITDKHGNEHSVDYDNYCDECDEYHEE